MAKKKPTELRPVMVRIPERLRGRLARTAKQNDRSMNSEMIFRLEGSFTQEDAFGSGELRAIAIAMSAAFASAGAGAAYSNSVEGDWVDDPASYRAAAFGVLKALMLRNGEAALDMQSMMNECDRLKAAVAAYIVNRGSRP